MPDIQIDTTRLSITKFRIAGLDQPAFDGNHGVTVSLPAGEHQFEQLIGLGATFPFSVSDDGVVHFDAQYAGFLDGDGTSTLRVTGFVITIDGRALPHDLDPRGWYVGPDGSGMLSRTTTHDVSVLPVQTPAYRFLSPSGSWTAAVFNVSLDGQLLVDDEYRQTFHVEGSTLRVTGFVITIDGRALPHDLDPRGWYVGPDGSGMLSRTTTHDVSVLPVQTPAYRFLSPSGSWTAAVFNVSLDGQLLVDDEYRQTFHVEGSTLRVDGLCDHHRRARAAA